MAESYFLKLHNLNNFAEEMYSSYTMTLSCHDM